MGEIVKCPECKMRFEVEDDLTVGAYTYCPNCELELKVMKVNPIKLENEKKSFLDFDGHDYEEDDYGDAEENEDEEDAINDW